MKVLILTLCLVTLAGCGEKKKNTSGMEANQRRTECGALTKTNLCMAQTQYVIFSKTALPAKIKVSRLVNNRMIEIVNECQRKSDFTIERGGAFDRVLFKGHHSLLPIGARLEIVDMGRFCDNDALFFDQVITPEFVVLSGKRVAKIHLNN